MKGYLPKSHESTIDCATRELKEELGLRTVKVVHRRDLDFKGAVSLHKICLVEVKNNPSIKGHELSDYMWWDLRINIPIYGHVYYVLNKLGRIAK